MIKEVIIVEGVNDIAAVKRAIDADCIATGGYSTLRRKLGAIEAAYNKRGIIILTDPDAPGERIRKFLSARFPLAKQAFVPKAQALGRDEVGIECASSEAIIAALNSTHYDIAERRTEFSQSDLVNNGLVGHKMSSDLRATLGMHLGIGWCNAKQLLCRLNNYGITRAEFESAVRMLNNTHNN